MSDSDRPFDFEADARSDFATGVVPVAGGPHRPAPGDSRRPHDEIHHDPAPGRAPDHRPDAHDGRTPGYLEDAPTDDDGHDDRGGRHEDRHHDGDHRDDYDDRYHDDAYDGYGDGYDDGYDEPEPEPERRRSRRREQADSSELLQRVIDIVSSARSLPLSASASINRDEVLELLEEAQQRLPDELREARWLRKEREDYLEKMRSDGDEIIGHARDRVEQMVQRTEIAKAAEHRARRIIENAEAEARRMRLETEDYCDHHLARFEIVLERTLKVVSSGRAKLQTTGVRPPNPDDGRPG